MGSKTAENESQGGGSKSYTDRSPKSADIWQMLLPAQPRRMSLVGNHEAPIGPGMVMAHWEKEMEMTTLMGTISPALLPCR